LAKEFERMGIPTVFITALPTIAQMVGANRVVRGKAITHPTGDPSVGADEERALRRALLVRAARMLETEVDPGTVWEASP
jgi:betaine reductase